LTRRPRPDSFLARDAERIVLCGLCLLAFAWRVHGLTFQSLWRDEVDSIRFATRALPEVLGMFSKPGENGPLFFALLRPWLAIAGVGEFSLRFQAVLAGVLAVPLTYLLARRLTRVVFRSDAAIVRGLSTRNVALVAAILVAVNPYLTWYSQEGKMYSLVLAVVLASQLAFLAALERSRWWRWVLYLALLAVAALLHVLAILVVLVDIAWLLLLWPHYRRRWLPFLATLLAPLAPYFALVGWWQVRLWLDAGFQTGHPFVPLHTIALGLLALVGYGVSSLPPAWLLAPAIFLALCGVAFADRAARLPDPPEAEHARAGTTDARRLAGMLLAWLLLPPLALFVISLSKPMYADRYLIWIAPAFLLLVALGLAGLAMFRRWLSRAALAFLVGLALWGGWHQSSTTIKVDMRSAAEYVAAHRMPDELVMFQIPYLRYTYEQYAGPVDRGVDGRYTNSGSTPQQVAAEMAAAIGDAPAVWLVLSEEPLWDSRGLVRQWLDATGRRTDARQFHGVEVARYQMEGVDK
jgi:4-amino-4-deoxy-L-arabinose transferase-like glycosyltransferase